MFNIKVDVVKQQKLLEDVMSSLEENMLYLMRKKITYRQPLYSCLMTRNVDWHQIFKRSIICYREQTQHCVQEIFLKSTSLCWLSFLICQCNIMASFVPQRAPVRNPEINTGYETAFFKVIPNPSTQEIFTLEIKRD